MLRPAPPPGRAPQMPRYSERSCAHKPLPVDRMGVTSSAPRWSPSCPVDLLPLPLSLSSSIPLSALSFVLSQPSFAPNWTTKKHGGSEKGEVGGPDVQLLAASMLSRPMLKNLTNSSLLATTVSIQKPLLSTPKPMKLGVSSYSVLYGKCIQCPVQLHMKLAVTCSIISLAWPQRCRPIRKSSAPVF